MDNPDYSEKFVTEFLKFYINHYNDDDLEIISTLDTHHYMPEFNPLISFDRNFRLKDIVPVLIKKHNQIINLLVNDIVKNGKINPDEMQSAQDWENWYRGQKAEIHEPDR